MTNDVRSSDSEAFVLPLAEEQLVVGRRRVETARVNVRTSVEQVRQSAETRLAHDTYEIERVAVGAFVDQPPAERREGDTLIIPVVEEVAVVVKRLRVVEEIRITRREFTTPFQESVEVRRMRASVERTPLQPTTPTKE